MKLKVFYSVQNGGDGSAYPTFMESEKLARFDQEHMSEGWGESCTGSISFESESPIKCLSDIQTKEAYFIENYCDDQDNYDSQEYDSERDKFISQFFPNGLPKFTVITDKLDGKYAYNNVFVGNERVAKVFRAIPKSGQAFEDFLNSISE